MLGRTERVLSILGVGFDLCFANDLNGTDLLLKGLLAILFLEAVSALIKLAGKAIKDESFLFNIFLQANVAIVRHVLV